MGESKIKYLMIIALVSIAFSGCAPKQQPLTPEQQAMKTKMMQAMVARMQNSSALLTRQASAIAPAQRIEPRKIYSESELASMAGESPILVQAVNFEKKQDGFTVDGVRYFDPEGEIFTFKGNSLTGEVAYFVKTGGKSLKTFTIKYVKVKSSDAPITIAQGIIHDDYMEIETASGSKMKGSNVIITSKGFVVIRNKTGFMYTIGKGIISFATPDHYHIAEFQQGDIQSTGFILLEKEKVNHEVNPIMGFLDSASDLGGALGLNEKRDYALMNVNSGKLIELNILYVASQQNNLFMNNGQKNSTHYYWRARWFKGLNGTYVLYHPNASFKEKALDLNSGKEIVLFDGTFGSVGWASKYVAENKLQVTLTKQLGTDVIDDFEAFFQSSEEISK